MNLMYKTIGTSALICMAWSAKEYANYGRIDLWVEIVIYILSTWFILSALFWPERMK